MNEDKCELYALDGFIWALNGSSVAPSGAISGNFLGALISSWNFFVSLPPPKSLLLGTLWLHIGLNRCTLGSLLRIDSVTPLINN